MGVLMTWLLSLVTSIITWLAAKFGAQIAIGATMVTLWLGMTAVLTNTLTALLGGISYGALNSFVIMGFSLVPDNVPSCFSTILSAEAAAWVYLQQKRILTLKTVGV